MVAGSSVTPLLARKNRPTKAGNQSIILSHDPHRTNSTFGKINCDPGDTHTFRLN
ncbi:MAG: hypothetical protein ACI9XZ_004127, partial [Alphaproteobacteria bacterium]